jgi:hypothetical protein
MEKLTKMNPTNQLEGKLDYNLPCNYSDDPRFNYHNGNCTDSKLDKDTVEYTLWIPESEDKSIEYIARLSRIKIYLSRNSPLFTLKAQASLYFERYHLKNSKWISSYSILKEIYYGWRKKKEITRLYAVAEECSQDLPFIHDGLSEIIVNGQFAKNSFLDVDVEGRDYKPKLAKQLGLDINFVAKMFQPIESLLMEWYKPQLEKQAKKAEEKLKKYYESRK